MPKHTVANPLSLVTHRTQARYGWHPDLPDARDHFYSAPLAKALPPAVDLRPNCPPVYDQSQLGSCTANAIAAAIEFDRKKEKLTDFVPSRLFIYYNERVMEGTVPQASGSWPIRSRSARSPASRTSFFTRRYRKPLTPKGCAKCTRAPQACSTSTAQYQP